MNEEIPSIENIEITSKEYIKIYLSDGNQKICHIDVFNLLKLKKGGKVDKNTIEKIVYESRKIFLNKALYNLISHKPRSKKEIKEKLITKGFSEVEIDSAIRHFTELGYIDDEKYAYDYYKSLISRNKYSSSVVKRKLLEKGISNKIIEKLDDKFYDPKSEYLLALKLAKKKIKTIKSGNDKEIKQRIYRYLLQKQFKIDVIKYVLEDIFLE